MNHTLSTTNLSAEALVGQVADEFLQRLNCGEQPDIDEYTRRHPEIDSILRHVLATLQLVRLPMDNTGNASPGEIADAMDRGCLGDFRILREVGRGGMGIVYEAEQISLNRRVALKVLPFAAALDPKQLQRFKNEAQAAAQLHHQNIVPVYGVGCERGVHYYAMQFIDGYTLAMLIRELRQGDEAVRWWDQEMLAEGAASPPRHSTAPTPDEKRGDEKRGQGTFLARELVGEGSAGFGPEKYPVPFSAPGAEAPATLGPEKSRVPSSGSLTPTLPLAALS